MGHNLRFFCYGCEKFIGEGTAINGAHLCDDCKVKEARKQADASTK